MVRELRFPHAAHCSWRGKKRERKKKGSKDLNAKPRTIKHSRKIFVAVG